MKWRLSWLCAFLLTFCFSPLSRAEDTVKIGILHSLSGTMAISETSLRDVVLMAVEEINAAGGILGKKIKLEFVDTASDPGKARAAMQRALDDKPIAVFGPIYSGSVSSTLKLTADAEVPQVMGGEAGPLTAQGSKYLFRTSFGQNVSMPGLRVFRSLRPPFVDHVKIGPSLAKIPLDALLALSAMRRAFSGRYDAIHSHEEAGLIGALLAMCLRRPPPRPI